MNFEVNNLEDLYKILDNLCDVINWEKFYEKRDKKPPFLVNNKTPDKVVVDFIKEHQVKSAIEFGCGEGRNSIYLAKNGIKTTGIDLSKEAIKNAINLAKESNVSVELEACDALKKQYIKKYDLAIDSGMFHHLAPHRRIQYKEILKKVLKKKWFLILLCFAAGENAADEVDDLEFYKKRRTGIAFTMERIENFFKDTFEIIEIKKGKQICNEQELENSFMYKCIMKLK